MTKEGKINWHIPHSPNQPMGLPIFNTSLTIFRTITGQDAYIFVKIIIVGHSSPLQIMKAMVYARYGPPEVVQMVEIDTPGPKDDEVLIRIHATTVTRTDSGFRSAEYFVSRFWSGLFRPKYPILGCEYAGTVVEVGKEVSRFRAGDRVFGYNDERFGGHAGYIAVREDDALETLPKNFDFYQAACMTEGAHYALGNIRAAKVLPGQQVLVYGATGAIGSAAVQLLKHFGAQVTAVSNSKNVELVKSLGAARVIDYQTEDFTRLTDKFDFIFDAVGKSSFKVCKQLLTPEGIYVSTELGKNGANVFLSIATRFSKGQKVIFPLPSIHREDLTWLKKLAENGEFTPVIDRYYRLEELVEAYRYVETGQKTGNVVIKVGDLPA